MPFPILYIVGGLLFGAAALTVFVLSLDELEEKVKGSAVAVIGPRTVGKTTLAKFLSSGKLATEYEQTVHDKTFKGRRISMEELELEICEINDVGGQKKYYPQWKRAVNRSDIVYYMARADWMMEKAEHRIRVLADVKHLCDWLGKAKSRKHVFFIATHCDLIPEYKKLTKANRGDFQDRFFESKDMREVRLRLQECNAHFMVASLKYKKSTHALVFESMRIILDGEA